MTANTFNVKPNPDKKVNGKAIKVRDPITGEFLPKKGKHVPRSAYWVRRMRVRDVVPVEAPATVPRRFGRIGMELGEGTTARFPAGDLLKLVDRLAAEGMALKRRPLLEVEDLAVLAGKVLLGVPR
mgnify:CR=1 FL=1